jgi:RNA recognition motif-containing protein
MIKLFIRGLQANTTDESLAALFAPYGKVRSLKLDKDLFSGRARGTAFIEMEGHEARAAIAGLDGTQFMGRSIHVSQDRGRIGARSGARSGGRRR